MPLRKMYFFRTKYLFPILICDIALLSQFITYLPIYSHSHPESGYNLTWKCVLFVLLSPSLVCSISITRLVIIINTNSNAVYIILCCYFCSYKKNKVTKFSFDCGTTFHRIQEEREERHKYKGVLKGVYSEEAEPPSGKSKPLVEWEFLVLSDSIPK